LIRATALALALLAASACGKYGPPVRASAVPAAKTQPVSTAPATGNTEECADPNAPSAPVTTP
jgi:hypothetical protein